MKTALPTLLLNHGYWKLILPAAIQPPEVANITISEDGVYIEFITGDYDLITWDDIAGIAIPGRLSAILASPNGNGRSTQWPNPAAWLVDDSPGVIPAAN
jgi:hypothetical protein